MPWKVFLFCFVVHKNLLFAFHTLFKRKWNILLISSEMLGTSLHDINFKLNWAFGFPGFRWFFQCAMNNWSSQWKEHNLTNAVHYSWEAEVLSPVWLNLVPRINSPWDNSLHQRIQFPWVLTFVLKTNKPILLEGSQEHVGTVADTSTKGIKREQLQCVF